MKKTILRRIAAFACTAVIGAGACAAFAGCTSNTPEVTITYTFMGKDYEVEYRLSRTDAPRTVQHFIDLADAGYYDGTCIHDYDSNFLYGGGYYFDEDGVLQEKDYFTVVKQLEADGHYFDQSVFTSDGNRTPLYTVYGEFKNNGCVAEQDNVYHSKGALVMYYTDKTKSAKDIEVLVPRADEGDNNDGEAEQELPYAYNSTTSLFYTFLGESNGSRDDQYAVIGKVIDFEGDLQPLLGAIQEVKDSLESADVADGEEAETFTRDTPQTLDQLDHVGDPLFESVRKGGTEATFKTPTAEPIIVTSVKVNKY